MKERQSSVLIVVAAPEDRAALRDALSRDSAARYVITEAESGLRALEVCRAWKPDCLILDLDLPDLSGLDALKELTAEEGGATCAVVALVGAGDTQFAVEAMKSGAHDCLEKARASGAELRRAVSQAIEKAEQRRQSSARERGRIFHDFAGKPLYATGAITDISARKQAEENLRQSESWFRATFENAAVGIAHVALDGRWLEVNQRLCDIAGYTREELLTKTFGDITHPDDLDADWGQARRLSAGEIENYSMEKRYYRKDGSIVWINLTVSLMCEADGSPDYFIAVVEDISARKLAEEALKGSEERLNLAMQAGDIGMADWRIRDDVIVLSEKLVEIYGLPPDKTTLRYEDWRERLYPEDLPAVEELIRGTFERKLPNWRIALSR